MDEREQLTGALDELAIVATLIRDKKFLELGQTYGTRSVELLVQCVRSNVDQLIENAEQERKNVLWNWSHGF